MSSFLFPSASVRNTFGSPVAYDVPRFPSLVKSFSRASLTNFSRAVDDYVLTRPLPSGEFSFLAGIVSPFILLLSYVFFFFVFSSH